MTYVGLAATLVFVLSVTVLLAYFISRSVIVIVREEDE